MAERLKILVTGATGNVGGQVAARLREDGHLVRAFTRDPAAWPGEAVRGDFHVPHTLAAAADGVDAAFLMWPLHTADTAAVLVDLLGERVRRVVFLSSGAVQDGLEPADLVGCTHAVVEQAIARSVREWTVLRPSAFAANTRWWAPQIRRGDVVRGAYGTVAAPLLHERDLAEVAVRALTSDGHHGARYHLTGPAALSQADQVAVVGEALGRPVRWLEVSRAESRRQLLVDGFPLSFVDVLLDAYAEMVARPLLTTTTTVRDVTGLEARSFLSWAVEHVGEFRG
ncbi:NAD(P)H-binding protein [Amycolatopsis sp. H20-H5]|uniref:NAD(P)H-binding protein n=1 Tax=Amycolatopsis sp. H20-H5 TaxID=3046309 RepID=UPI002DBC3CC4|nr:NAD(P)H-binding protein [Amycolatopsis sp. H20-H5]MEC3982516.1 NAD(P)H-binding protein [Amycolatopsis sp. H20-H5]